MKHKNICANNKWNSITIVASTGQTIITAFAGDDYTPLLSSFKELLQYMEDIKINHCTGVLCLYDIVGQDNQKYVQRLTISKRCAKDGKQIENLNSF